MIYTRRDVQPVFFNTTSTYFCYEHLGCVYTWNVFINYFTLIPGYSVIKISKFNTFFGVQRLHEGFFDTTNHLIRYVRVLLIHTHVI